MRNMKRVFFATLLLWCGSSLALGQQRNGSSVQPEPAEATATQNQSKDDQRPKFIRSYRLDFALSELAEGKKTNSRHYSLNLTAGSSDEVKIGTRVPIASADTPSLPTMTYQYLDVGTSIWALLREAGDQLQLEVKSDISWTKHDDADVSPKAPRGALTPPIVSHIQINGSTLLVVGKTLVLGSVDDPYSNREFQLEVTATKL